jgi:starvation-inducible outer membrane lipoprotein
MKTLTPFQQEAQLAIAKANSLGFNFNFDLKLNSSAWGYIENIKSKTIESVTYKLIRVVSAGTTMWRISSIVKYIVVQNESLGVYTENMQKIAYNRGGEQENLVCMFTI